MRFIKRFALLVIAVIATAPVVSAQFSVGPRLGINVNSLHFSDDLIKADNRTGFTGGLQAEFMIPAVGFGFDASLMYVHRSTTEINNEKASKDYIEIPVNLKYKFGMPIVGSILKPYIFTGPSFAFLTSEKAITEFMHSRSSSVAWNFGFGLEFFRHLQVGASYGLGLSKSIAGHIPGASGSGNVDIEGKNRYWTVTAAWLF